MEYQHDFSSSYTIRSKQSSGKVTIDHEVIVESYLADNGVFKANAYVQHITQQHF